MIMKHLREDYNVRIQDAANIIPANEPVFLLRGQDIFAPGLLLDWAKQLRLAGGDPEHARKVEDWAQEMIVWQKANPERMLRKNRLHIPDMPKEHEVVKLLSEPYETVECHFAIDVLAKVGEIEVQTILEVNNRQQAEAVQTGYKFIK